MVLELEKRNLHRNRWKSRMDTQITMDDDFIVPDALSDAAQVIVSSGEVELEPVNVQKEKAVVRGSLQFCVLYRTEGDRLQPLSGQIPFEEEVNMPGLAQRDAVTVRWQLDDLSAGLINSRKLGIRALVTLKLSAETPEDTELAVGLSEQAQTAAPQKETEEPEEAGEDRLRVEVKKDKLSAACAVLNRRDTFRVKEELELPANKPSVERLLWTELRLTGVTTRPLSGKIGLSGTLSVFALYEGEEEQAPVEWAEFFVPFDGEVEAQDAEEKMIPFIRTRLIHKGLEAKPDSDGEMRNLSVDAVIELDIRLLKEQEMEYLGDLYAPGRELTSESGEAYFDRILTRNSGKCRIADRVELKNPGRILQICRGTGNVKVDEAIPGNGSLTVNGVMELQILYLTDDDAWPLQSASELLPFSYEAETPGITADSVWYLEPGLDQFTAVMAGGTAVEVKAVISLDLLVLQPQKRRVLTGAELLPADPEKFQDLPGLVGYLVKEGDTLWDVAKRFHTTGGTILEINGLQSGELVPGTCLILVKETGR